MYTRLFPSSSPWALFLHLAAAGAEGWAYYGGDEGGSRYSALQQINRDNVGKLELAWQYRTGAVAANPTLKSMIDFQATPTLLPAAAGAHLVVCDPFGKVIALDPASGKERWVHGSADRQDALCRAVQVQGCRLVGGQSGSRRTLPAATACFSLPPTSA